MYLFKNCDTLYFPNAYPSDLIKPLENINKEYFLGFCGTPFNYRVDSINLIEKKLNLQVKNDYYKLGNEMIESINSYKIHFNKSENDDINYRVFETMGCKTLLLTSNNENINTFFTDMFDIVIYNSDEEMLEKIKFLQNNQHIIETISNNGYENVIKNHTYDVRAIQLIAHIKKIK
jgi:spore maturation protein CgeB